MELVDIHYEPSWCWAQLNWWTMALFQAFYAAFCMASDCVLGHYHKPLLYTWATFYGLHTLTLLWICRRDFCSRIGGILVGMSGFATVSIILTIIPAQFHTVKHGGLGAYLFWLFEALCISAIVGIGPVLVAFGQVDEDSAVHRRGFTKETKAEKEAKAASNARSRSDVFEVVKNSNS